MDAAWHGEGGDRQKGKTTIRSESESEKVKKVTRPSKRWHNYKNKSKNVEGQKGNTTIKIKVKVEGQKGNTTIKVKVKVKVEGQKGNRAVKKVTQL